MSETRTPTSRALQDKTFLLLLVAVTAAFAWILWPYFGAILWACILAVLFAPVYRRLCARMHERRSLAALLTLLAVLVIVIVPGALIGAMLMQEGLGVYARLQSGEIDLEALADRAFAGLPGWLTPMLDGYGLTDLSAVREKFSAGMTKGLQFFASRALNIGQNTLEFVVGFGVMLYLLFFLLRDGAFLAARAKRAIPLREDLQHDLAQKFATVIRATIKGNIVVAIVQGALGGFAFWFLGVTPALLWAVVMAFLSLLPAVGTALVWGPVAVYLLATGATWQGIVLIAYGVLVIGLVDNVLRPLLVGKDTRMPDYVVLLSTLGGMTVFGFNGFVIGPIVAAMFIAVWDTLAGRDDAVAPAR
ncbi:MAG TPA: AI-2E family transporter [Burkholderiales bacterium]|nr:AI-2E family transporter [Burkholderiales bacterium]